MTETNNTETISDSEVPTALKHPSTLDMILAFSPVPVIGELKLRKCMEYVLGREKEILKYKTEHCPGKLSPEEKERLEHIRFNENLAKTPEGKEFFEDDMWHGIVGFRGILYMGYAGFIPTILYAINHLTA